MKYVLGTIIAIRACYYGKPKPESHGHYRIPWPDDHPIPNDLVELTEDDSTLVCDRCKP